jgi:mono/diheme cytochrome c family protein
MRAFTFLAIAALAACSRESHQAAAMTAQAAFDGASVTNAAARIAHGQRISLVLGCRGCHTDTLTGQNIFADDPQFGAVYAPNLTQFVPRHSDKQIEAILRTGVEPTRKDLWGMPSATFQNLSPNDMAALIAYLRSLKPSGEPSPPPQISALAKKQFIDTGQVKPEAQFVAEARLKPSLDLGPRYALGHYITSVTCAECHGSDLKGTKDVEPGLNSPNLIVVGGYTRADFERLMTTGVPFGGRKLRLMDQVAKHRFAKMTPHERDALYAYLKARADQPAAN